MEQQFTRINGWLDGVRKRRKIMDNKKFAYKVRVQTTDGLKKSFRYFNGHGYTYGDCIDGEIIIVTDDPRKIYDKFGDSVLSIEKINYGYVL